VDQMMNMCWKYLVPISFAGVLFVAVWMLVVHSVPMLGVAMRVLLTAFGAFGVGAFVVRTLKNIRDTGDNFDFTSNWSPTMPESVGGYVKNVRDTAKSFWEGMSVTLSYMFRKPITTQYPDRTAVPVRDTIPARYRGFLEVDMDICTACQACERACPIQVINIDILKGDGKITPKLRMERFDIDIGKCMYCGLCVEPCPTGAIQHTREFEGAVMHFNNLTLRFVPDPLVPAVPYKPPKGAKAFPRQQLGE